MFVKLTIFRRVNDSLQNRKKMLNESQKSKTSEIEKEKENIYDLISKNANYTVKQISKAIGISEASVQRRLESLQKEKRICRIGSKKSGKWKINKY
jgi:ATP-dependent DNA helicase RecG